MAKRARVSGGRRLPAPRGGALRRGRLAISKEDRVKTRKQLDKLRGLVMTKRVENRYKKALQRFFHFEEINGERYSTSEVALDQGVCCFIESLWQAGEPRYWGEDVISALVKAVPQLKGFFPGAWQLVSAWQKHELPQRCVPLTVNLLKAMCGVAISWGNTSMALCLAVAFQGILRTEETYSMAVKDFTFHPFNGTCVLTLPFTKSGTRFNVVESVVLDDAALNRKLREHFRSLPATQAMVYAEGSRIFRGLFDEISAYLLLPNTLLYKPYSIRRGAATEFFRMTGSLSRTTVRGRWQNEKTCRIYINESMSMMGDIQFSPRCRDRIAHFAKVAEVYFS